MYQEKLKTILVQNGGGGGQNFMGGVEVVLHELTAYKNNIPTVQKFSVRQFWLPLTYS